MSHIISASCDICAVVKQTKGIKCLQNLYAGLHKVAHLAVTEVCLLSLTLKRQHV